MKKKLICMFLALVSVISMLPVMPAAAADYSKSQLDSLMDAWNSGIYAQNKNTSYGGATQCAAFTRFLFYELWGHYDGESNTNNKLMPSGSDDIPCTTEEQLMNYLKSYAKPGDSIRLTSFTGDHIMHLYDIDREGNLSFYESNFEGNSKNKARFMVSTLKNLLGSDQTAIATVNYDGTLNRTVYLTIIHALNNTETQFSFVCSHVHENTGKTAYVYHNKDMVKCSLCQDVYPTPTLSGEGTYMDITLAGSDKTSAPGHFDAPYKEAPVGNRYKAGQTVYVRGSFVNARGNTWYQLASGEWLSGEYLTAHTHRWNSEGICPYCYAYKDGKDVGYYYAVWTGPTTLKVDHAKIHFAAYGKSPRFMTYTGEITVDAKVVNGHGKEWYRIYDDRWNGGWIWQGYVETTHQKVKLSVETDIWYCPSWDHGTVGHIPANAEFTYYPDEISQYDPNWRAVRYKDTVGFVPGYILDNNLTGSRVVEPDHTPEDMGESLNDTEVVGGGGSSSGGSSSGGGSSSSTFSVSVQFPTDPAYLAKRVIGETTATLVANIQKPAGSSVTACGLRIFSSDGTLLKDHRETVTNVGASLTSFHAWYDIQSELGLTLMPGTDYMYQFYAVVDGVTHEGGRTGFTTNGTTPVTPPSAPEEPKQEVVLYELTLDPNGAPVEKQVRKIPYTTTIGVLPVPIWDGYTFNGWYTQKEGGSKVNDYATYNATQNITLYAHWTPKTYNLIFKPNGGVCATQSKAIVFDTIIGDMPVPTRSGYVFDGWYSKAEGGNPIHGQMRYNAPFDVTIYAHWRVAMSDVATDAWYANAVDYVVKNGLMSGYSANKFGPNDTLNRAMVVQVLYNKEGQPGLNGAKHAFSDVPSSQWFNNAVTWGSKRGVVSGFGGGLFKPEDAVTIEQVAVILHNYAGKPTGRGALTNVGRYSDWAANALRWCVETGVLENVPFTNSTEKATRAQTAQILTNFVTAGN